MVSGLFSYSLVWRVSPLTSLWSSGLQIMACAPPVNLQEFFSCLIFHQTNTLKFNLGIHWDTNINACHRKTLIFQFKWIHFYIALYCLLLYTQSTLQSCGGGGGLSSTTTSVQHPLGWCDCSHSTTAPVRSPHTSYRWRVEKVIEPIQWIRIIRSPWLTRASGSNLARTLWLHPYSLREVPWDF